MPSARQRMIVEGLPEFRKTILAMTGRELDDTVLKVLQEMGEPTQMALLQYFDSRTGKHDGESLQRALQHRWWNKYRKQGLPVGYTRNLAIQALVRDGKDGWGFKVAKLKRGLGYLLRLKAWGPGMFLMESGRHSKRSYRGFNGAFSILKRFRYTAESQLNRKLPEVFERLAAKAAARNGVK
jgi:hypothetical protein